MNLILEQEIYIHYGSQKFIQDNFGPALNNGFPSMKPMPETGLWGSPVNSIWGWKQWCESEEFRECREEDSFRFRLDERANIYTIHDYSDLDFLPLVSSRYSVNGLDFQKIAETYDAIYLTEHGQNTTRFSRPLSLYGWDCESILVLKSSNLITS